MNIDADMDSRDTEKIAEGTSQTLQNENFDYSGDE